MTQQTQQQLNNAQKLIYSRTNIRRAFQDFDETDIAGIHRSGNNIVVVRTDGNEQTFPAESIQHSYKSYTARLKNFFAYLGPNYRGPGIWHNGTYVILKGWNYVSQLSHKTSYAQMQNRWIDKFIAIQDQDKLLICAARRSNRSRAFGGSRWYSHLLSWCKLLILWMMILNLIK